MRHSRRMKGKMNYNLIAGTSVERLAALSDGIFAVAMTLLVLDLHVPESEAVERVGLWAAIGHLAPQLLVYLMSFLTLGIFWVGQQTQLNHLERSDRNLTWIHLAFLFVTTLLPFSTRLLGEYIWAPAALIIYWANILLFGVTLYASWGWAVRANLVKEDFSYEQQSAICRRILVGQGLYAFGAALCFFNTYLSIAVIVLVQLNYVIAPGDWRKKD